MTTYPPVNLSGYLHRLTEKSSTFVHQPDIYPGEDDKNHGKHHEILPQPICAQPPVVLVFRAKLDITDATWPYKDHPASMQGSKNVG